jgi:hypothetical protein
MTETEIRRIAHEEAIKATQNILAINACIQLADVFYTLPLEAVKGHLAHLLTVELRRAVYDDDQFRELLHHVVVTSEQILSAAEIK